MSTTFGSALRDRWLLRRDMLYLNNGSFGATPRVVLDAQRDWQERMERQPVEFILREMPGELRKAAATMAEFLGADADDFVFVENASTGVSSVIHSLMPTLQPGDELLTTSHVYNAVRQTMKHGCGLIGARYVEVDVPFPLHSPDQVVECIRSAITDRTKFLLTDHVTSPTGLVFPLAEIISLCRERGVLVMVDGAHAPGMIALDLNALDADWYTGNFHKWLFAPKGAAFLRTRKELQSMTHPLIPSHNYMQGYVAEFDYHGTRDWSAYLSAPAALKFLRELGVDEVRQHNRELVLKARRHLINALPQPDPCPESMLASLAAIVLPVESDDSLNESLRIHDMLWDEHQIEVPVFPLGKRLLLRVSAQVYNEEQQYVQLADVLRDMFAN